MSTKQAVSALDYMRDLAMPAALTVLQPQLNSKGARAMLLAIGLQVSGFTSRRTEGWQGKGFFRMEAGGGVATVLRTPASSLQARAALTLMGYGHEPVVAHYAIEHNDILAAVFARLLLWTLPDPLPVRRAPELAWGQFQAAWRPERSDRDTWDALYEQAWSLA